MIRDIRRSYFEIWGNEEAQNVFLKGLLTLVSCLFLVQSIALCIVAMKKPTLVAIGSSETKILTLTPPTAELLSDELKRIVKKYAETHYSWDSSTVEKAHENASHYVGAEFIKAFNAANLEQVKLAKDKKLSQRVYFTDVSVDSKALTARISMDRILSIEGLRAVSSLVLDLSFEYGPRISTNPEGIYITSEKVVRSEAN